MGCGLVACRESLPTSSIAISRYFAARTMNIPDPAAHLSLVLKVRTLPDSLMVIARVDWPPISSTQRELGNR
jgi:hypothetical protein